MSRELMKPDDSELITAGTSNFMSEYPPSVDVPPPKGEEPPSKWAVGIGSSKWIKVLGGAIDSRSFIAHRAFQAKARLMLDDILVMPGWWVVEEQQGVYGVYTEVGFRGRFLATDIEAYDGEYQALPVAATP